MFDPNDYTVGWICALSTEYVAAQECLDEELDGPDFLSDNDNNIYTLGKIGRHNVVIAACPDGEYGTTSATVVARDMLHSFPNIRVGLMVGIAGAAPLKCDIRLGDVVVSTPCDGMSGVFQYDFGKTIQDQGFQWTKALNQPPLVLRAAVSAIKAQYTRKGHRIGEMINSILEKNPKLQPVYSRPDRVTDQLFKSEFTHEHVCGGAIKCELTSSNLVARRERGEFEDNPSIHYGVIASGNQVMKDAVIRDTLEAQNNILCFEMEAAGLMNHFPCLVIRGISDYSDTHKNEQWQGYAALTAAVYAKELLCQIPPKKLAAERRIIELVSEALHALSRTETNISEIKSRLNRQEELEILNWLTVFDHNSQQNDRICRRQIGTVEWLLESSKFQNWLHNSKHTLFCHGIPGAGKTIAASIVIDHLHRTFQNDDSVGIGFVFFNFNHSKVSHSDILLSLLKQLCRCSVPDPVKGLHKSHIQRGTRPSPDELSHIIQSLVERFSRTFIVIDALDECSLSDGARSTIITELLSIQKRTHANLFVTSRRIFEIAQVFEKHGCTTLEIRAKDQDIRKYVEGQLSTFPAWIKETDGLERRITTAVIEAADGMFLLPNYHLQSLREQTDVSEIEEVLENLPKGQDALPIIYNEAMGRIKSQPEKLRRLALRVLSWITQCQRPLATSELQHALAVKANSSKIDPRCIKDLRLIIEVCAGLVEVDEESDLIRLAHYTTQEYFAQYWKFWFPEANHDIATVSLRYLTYEKFSIKAPESWEEYRNRLHDNCLYEYAALYWGHHAREAYPEAKGLTQMFLQGGPAFLGAVQVLLADKPLFRIFHAPEGITGLHITAHYGIDEEVINFLQDTPCHKVADGSGRTPLHWAVRSCQVKTVELLVQEGLDVNATDTEMRSALHCAASHDDPGLTRFLLRHGALIEARDIDGQTPLLVAANNVRVEVAQELLSHGADIDALDNMNRNALHLTIMSGKPESVPLAELLTPQIDFNACDVENMTPLLYAVARGKREIIDMLIKSGADINLGIERRYWFKTMESGRSIYKESCGTQSEKQKTEAVTGLTPLHFAACIGHKAMTAYLLSHNSNPNAQSRDGDTPLHVALRRGLWETKREPQGPYEYALPYQDGWTDSKWQVELATESISDSESDEARDIFDSVEEDRRLAVVNTLLGNTTIQVNIQNIDGNSPLHLIRYDNWGAEATVERLLVLGADLSAQNKEGQTALHLACKSGASAVACSFLDHGCSIKATDAQGLNPLHYAVCANQYDAVKIVLGRDKELARDLCREVDVKGRTLLHHHMSALICSPEMVTILLDHGAGINHEDNEGNTALSLFLRKFALGDKTNIVRHLLQHGADARWSTPEGENLAHLAMWNHTADLGVLNALSSSGVDLWAKDNSGRSILHHGAIHGSLNEEVFNFFLERGPLHSHDRDKEGKTPADYASEEASKRRSPDTFAEGRWKQTLEYLQNLGEADLAKSKE